MLELGLAAAVTYAETGHEEYCPDINGPACAAMPVAPQWHQLRLGYGDVRLTANYGITGWLSLDLLWSLRIVVVRFELQDLATRRPITSPYGEEIHHRDEVIAGPTDPWITLRGAHAAGRWSFGYRLGLTAPVGSTQANPFRLAREGMTHQHIQLGTGTVDPVLELSAQVTAGRFRVGAWVLGKASLYENHHGFQASPYVLGGLRLSSDLWAPKWRFTVGVMGYHEEAERWSGVIETEGNLGRTDLMVETAITWAFADKWGLVLGGRAPVWSQVVGSQLSPAIVEIGVTRSFELHR